MSQFIRNSGIIKKRENADIILHGCCIYIYIYIHCTRYINIRGLRLLGITSVRSCSDLIILYGEAVGPEKSEYRTQ